MKWLVPLALLSWSATALADPCSSGPSVGSGPVQVSLADGEAGLARRACPATELGIGGAGVLLIDEPNFFGQVRVAGQLWGSWAWTERTESFVSLELVRFQAVISSVSASELGFGHVTVGGMHRFLIEDDWTVGSWARLVLPTAFGLYENAWPVSVDAGATTEMQLTSGLVAHSSLGAGFSAAFSRGPAQPRIGLDATVGGGWQPFSWFALVVDLDAGFGQTAALDHLAARLALRFRIARHWDVNLAAMAPFAGRERSLAAGALRVSWHP